MQLRHITKVRCDSFMLLKGTGLAIDRSQVGFPAATVLGATLGKLFSHVPLDTKQCKFVPV